MPRATGVRTDDGVESTRHCAANVHSHQVREQVARGVFGHLPIVEGDQVKAVLSMRDIAQQIAAALAKQARGAARDPPTPLTNTARQRSHQNHTGAFRSRSPTPVSSPT